MRLCLHSFACVQYCLLFYIVNGGEYTIRTQQNIPELTQQRRTVTAMTTRQTDTISNTYDDVYNIRIALRVGVFTNYNYCAISTLHRLRCFHVKM